LKKELELIRKQGFTQSNSEVDSGAGSVAAPIFDHNGGIAASLTVVGPADRILLGETREVLISKVTDIARKISLELGHIKDLTKDSHSG
jgi:DNA-binding IclR family transcriptional regulator